MANTPRFFKIILDRNIRDGKLGIPKKFVRLYGNHLSSHVLLKVCNDESWKIELNKCDDEIWLQNGWQKFANRYGLAHGHLLVFEFHRKINSYFNVLIFDKSATEIDYPFIQFVNLEEESETLPCRKMKGKQEQKSDSEGFVASEQQLSFKAKRRACAKVKANFTSKNPYFMVAMQPSYVSGAVCRLTIPASFAMRYLKHRHGDAILNDWNGKSWSIRYLRQNYTNGSAGAVARICSGWMVFAKNHELKIGDVCAFELIKASIITFKVTIFRRSKDN